MNNLKHLAIIMDGNGRWAERQEKIRAKGHEEGAKNVRAITEYAASIGIKYLTLYAFSTENWKRPQKEVDFLMKLLAKFLKNELKFLLKNDIRFETIGDLSKLATPLQKSILHVKEQTAICKGLTQIVAINYGSRDELTRAINVAIAKGKKVSEDDISELLDTALFPNVDLLIRTGGDQRLSNFLLWQAAYAELFFTHTLWPDFSPGELETILSKYTSTTRKFGAL
jgi:undecaprenyl diphosphate synthase